MTRNNRFPFSWEVIRRDSTATLMLRGELDLAGVAAAKEKLIAEVVEGDERVVVDATLLDFMDSTGLRLLLDLKHRLGDADRTLSIGPVSPAVARILDVSGVRPAFDNVNGNGR